MTEVKILLYRPSSVNKLCIILILLYGQTRNPVVLDSSACKNSSILPSSWLVGQVNWTQNFNVYWRQIVLSCLFFHLVLWTSYHVQTLSFLFCFLVLLSCNQRRKSWERSTSILCRYWKVRRLPNGSYFNSVRSKGSWCLASKLR